MKVKRIFKFEVNNVKHGTYQFIEHKFRNSVKNMVLWYISENGTEG